MGEITLTYYLVLAALLFCAGLLIILIKRNVIFVLIGIELILNAANLNLAAFSRFDQNMDGQILAIFSVVLAAAEAAIALAILLNIHKQFKTSDLDELTELEN